MTSPATTRGIWITWERQRRSLELAEALGAKLFVLAESSSSISNRMWRYLRLSWKTLKVLRTEAPQVVFVQNPSMFLAALTCLLKSILGYTLVVDRHSNFKLDKRGGCKWPVFHWLSRYTIRHADLTIVTNTYLAQLVERWGGKSFVLQDKLPDLNSGTAGDLPGAGNIVFIAGFGQDEPTLEVLAAAQQLPAGWRLHITGRSRKFLETKLGGREIPRTVTFCGFLSEADYQSLLRSADLVMVLTRNDHTLTCGAYEAVTLGQPMVLSNTAAIRSYFHQGAEYCAPDVQSIASALARAIERRGQLQQESLQLQTELKRSWPLKFAKLEELLNALSTRPKQ